MATSLMFRFPGLVSNTIGASWVNSHVRCELISRVQDHLAFVIERRDRSRILKACSDFVGLPLGGRQSRERINGSATRCGTSRLRQTHVNCPVGELPSRRSKVGDYCFVASRWCG